MSAPAVPRRDRSCPCGTAWLDSDDVLCPECRRDPDERCAEIAAVVPPVEELIRRRSGFPGGVLATTTAEIVELVIRKVDAGRAAVAPGDQPPPVPNEEPSVHERVCTYLRGRAHAVVLTDLMERARVGVERYGTRLQARNGRDARWDGYQEALDGLAYAGQLVAEATPEAGPFADRIAADTVLTAQLAACEAWARLVRPELAEETA